MCCSQVDSAEVSIFAFDKTGPDKHRLSAAQNCMQKLRSTRHPDVLRFIEGVELTANLYIVTEAVEPISMQSPEFEPNNPSLILGLRQLVVRDCIRSD